VNLVLTDFTARPVHGGNVAWAAELAGCSPTELVDFSASINPLGPPKSAIAAIQAHIGELGQYPDPQYRQLRAVLGAFHQVSPDWVIPGNGAAELITWAARDLSAYDATCLLTPAFSDYGRALKGFGGKVVTANLLNQTWHQALDQALAKHDLDPAHCGLLLNSPHNPTGLTFSPDAIRPYLDGFGLVVVDEAFMDFLPPPQQTSLIPWLADYPNLVVVRSLTKFYSLPGLRLGYALGHPDRLAQWQQWRDPWPVNTLAAAAAEAAVQDHAFQQRTWDWLAAARPALNQALQQIPGLQPWPSTANFMLVGCKMAVPHLQQQLLQRHRLLIRDCLSFPSLGADYFRVAIKTNSDNQRLASALADILKFHDS
jgi:L-threonine-O-3-phosphate decarboxylase